MDKKEPQRWYECDLTITVCASSPEKAVEAAQAFVDENTDRWTFDVREEGSSHVIATIEARGLMDPEANVKQQREISQRIVQLEQGGGWDDQQLIEEAANLAELVLALDEWRLGGGYDPYMKERRAADP